MTARERAFGALCLGVALLVLAGGVATQIDQPALYFDEVYADHLVVPLLYPNAVDLPIWLPPGNYLFHRFPLLVQLYHGALPMYLGWPLYALLGTDVVAVRIVHGVFAASILVLAWFVMRRSGVPAWLAGMTIAALSLDPAFLFAFRTQYYILLVPLIPFFAGVLIAQHAGAADSPRASLWSLVAGGFLAGLACYGYFIYFALVPALAWFAIGKSAPVVRPRSASIAWFTGCTLGVAPYPIGLMLIASATGSTDAMQEWLRAYFAGLDTGVQLGGVVDRVVHFVVQLWRALTAEALTLDVFGQRTIRADGLASGPSGDAVGQSGVSVKLAAIIVVCIAGALLVRRDRPAGRISLLIGGCFAGLFVLTLVFGRRLAAHHFAPAVPLLYILFSVALSTLMNRRSMSSSRSVDVSASARTLAVAVALLPVGIGAANALNRQQVFRQLRADAATWMFHQSVSRFAQRAATDTRPTYYFFPDWGLFTSFVMITRGAVPFWTDFVAARAKSELCSGRDVVVVSTRPGDDPRIERWTAEIGWTAPQIDEFKQRDGKRIFRAARWTAHGETEGGHPCL